MVNDLYCDCGMDTKMNERIRELSEQAEKYADINFRGEPTWSEAFESKFAELIVRECAGWIDGSPSTDAGQLVLTKSFIIANIKEHFGVDE